MIEDTKIDPENDLHFPALFAVSINKGLKEKGVNVYFSEFSVPKGTDTSQIVRGIANIGFLSPAGLRNNTVTLRVYITFDEREIEGIDIKVLKDYGWQPLGAVFIEQTFGVYAGYLEGVIELGDPPIAVG